MFYYLHGSLVHLEPSMAVVDVGGVGFQLTISQNTYDYCAKVNISGNKDILLYTFFSVREDGMDLYGFCNEQELSSYKMLISVSGVGPKAAMAVLSILTSDQLSIAICNEDVKKIAKANGVGAKTAARIVLELKDKMMKEFASSISTPQTLNTLSGEKESTAIGKGNLADAMDTLTVLGFSRSEVLTVLREIDVGNMSVQEIVKTALKKMGK